MAAARLGVTRVSFSSARGFTIAEPAGCADDDTLLLFTATDTTHNSNGTPPTGWTKMGSVNAGSSDTTLSGFWKRRAGAESATWTNIFSVIQDGLAFMLAYRGARADSPLDVAPVFAAVGFGNAWQTGLITPVSNDVKLVGVFGADPNAAYTFAWTAPASEWIDSDTTPSGLLSGSAYIAIGDATVVTPAGATRLLGTLSDDDQAASAIVALAPAAVAAAFTPRAILI